MERKVKLIVAVYNDGVKYTENVKLLLERGLDTEARLHINVRCDYDDCEEIVRRDYEKPIGTMRFISDGLGNVGFHIANVLENLLKMLEFKVEEEYIESNVPFNAEREYVARNVPEELYRALYELIKMLELLLQAFGGPLGAEGSVSVVDAYTEW